ncbi:MAG: hypothetical protein Q9202_006194 [Teloschistes flavicans]
MRKSEKRSEGKSAAFDILFASLERRHLLQDAYVGYAWVLETRRRNHSFPIDQIGGRGGKLGRLTLVSQLWASNLNWFEGCSDLTEGDDVQEDSVLQGGASCVDSELKVVLEAVE